MVKYNFDKKMTRVFNHMLTEIGKQQAPVKIINLVDNISILER